MSATGVSSNAFAAHPSHEPPRTFDSSKTGGFTAVNGETNKSTSFRPFSADDNITVVASSSRLRSHTPPPLSDAASKHAREEKGESNGGPTIGAAALSPNSSPVIKRQHPSEDRDQLPQRDTPDSDSLMSSTSAGSTTTPPPEASVIEGRSASVRPTSEALQARHFKPANNPSVMPDAGRAWNPADIRPETSRELQESLQTHLSSARARSPEGARDPSLAKTDSTGKTPRPDGDDMTNGHSKRQRGFSHRTKSGCHTCRKRKKKCDEGKPHCINCIRGKFVCAGYGAKAPVGFKAQSRHSAKVQHTLQAKPPEYGSVGRQPMGPTDYFWQHNSGPAYSHEIPRHGPPPPSSLSHGPPSQSQSQSQPQPQPQPPQQAQSQSQSQSQPQPPPPPPPPQQQQQQAPPPPPPPLPPPHQSMHQYGPTNPEQRENWHHHYPEAQHIHLQFNKMHNVDYSNIPQFHQGDPRPRPPPSDPYTPLSYRASAVPPPTFTPRESAAPPSRRSDYLPPLLTETERDKMLIGQPYRHWKDSGLIADRLDCKTAVDLYNRAALPSEALSQDERANRFTAILDPSKRTSRHGNSYLLGRVGRCGDRTIVEAPFHCDYGFNLTFGEDVVVYPGCYMQDPCEISIGNRAIIGPNVRFYGMTASIDVKSRAGSQGNFLGGSIRVEEDAYIGGDVTILPYRVIGRGAIVGAGSVVTRNVKPYTIVAGNPAKEVRYVGEQTLDRHMRTDIQEENENMIKDMKMRRYTRRSASEADRA